MGRDCLFCCTAGAGGRNATETCFACSRSGIVIGRLAGDKAGEHCLEVSCKSYPQIMALLLFGGPHSSRGNWYTPLLFDLSCGTLGTVATEAARKPACIIGVNVRVVLTARYRHIRKPVVDQQFAFVCIHLNQHSVRGLSLAAVAGDGVPVVEMWMLADIESNLRPESIRISRLPEWLTRSIVPSSRLATCSSREGAVN
jgi:hypothetical protein